MTIEFSVLNNIYVNIRTHVCNIAKYDDMCVAGVIRELCDSWLLWFVNSNQLNSMIDSLCIKYLLMYIYKYFILQTIYIYILYISLLG